VKGQLTLTGSETGLFANTKAGSQGQGGNNRIDSHSMLIQDGATISVDTQGSGTGGNIFLQANQIELQNKGSITAQTSGIGNAGGITINADTLALSGRAQISTNTFSSGRADDLNVDVKDQLTLTGSGTGLFASTEAGSTGNGGNITIDTHQVLIQDGATIAVDSKGSGIGGNIFITAGKLTLNNGSITAETANANGGNIFITTGKLLVLRNHSQISSTAGNNQAGGNGGNITISAPFIVGVLSEDNDIRANAFKGNGGNITINANGVYGFLFPPQDTPFSDITASSQLGINGTITLNTLNLDPSQGLQELNLTPIDPSRLVVQNCNNGRKVTEGQSRFVVLGRGGFSTSPDDWFSNTPILPDLGAPSSPHLPNSPTFPIRPAQHNHRSPNLGQRQRWQNLPGTVI
jgi:large exoprotein involved in heme utilization and adhesion